MKYPIITPFITAIDLGINFPIYTCNTAGLMYPITKQSEFISFYDKIKAHIYTDPSNKDKYMKELNEYYMVATNVVAENLLKECPQFSVLAIENLEGNGWIEDLLPMNLLLKKIYFYAEKYNVYIYKVSPYNTSNTCPICGNINKYNRHKETHLYTCNMCGLICNDDAIAAWNILNIAYKELFGNKPLPKIYNKTVVMRNTKAMELNF